MKSQDFLNWYETSLPTRERKLRGHFSTPPHLVEEILDACGYTPLHDLARIRVLDPACGSGNFLVGATQRLIEFGQCKQRTDTSIANLIQHNIWGFDPDPVACFLAEMQVRTAFSAKNTLDAHMSNSSSIPGYPQIDSKPSARGQLRRLHIHQTDGLTIPWNHCENVDLFLANPPYLASKNNDLSGYRTNQQRGQSDSYLLFLSLALQTVRPKGWIGLILPDPLLARANAQKERQRLLAETTIHHLWHLADVFTAYVGAVVIIAQKCPPCKTHQIFWKREQWHRVISMDAGQLALAKSEAENAATYHLAQKKVCATLFSQQAGAEFRYLLSDVPGTLVERLHKYLNTATASKKSDDFAPLSDFVLIRRGEELGKDSMLLSKVPLPDNEQCYPVLRGGADIRPYAIPHAQHWIAHSRVAKKLERYFAPKLLVVKSTGRLQATLDLQGHIVLQTLYLLQLHKRPSDKLEVTQHDEGELYFFLALLNSRLLQEYIYILHTAYKWIQPQIEQRVLMQIPIPAFPDAQTKKHIIQRAKILTSTCSMLVSSVELEEQNKEIYEEQERAICALYELALLGKRGVMPTQHREDKEPLCMAETNTNRPIRVLVAKPGLDGHDRGAKVIARALRDAGMEVIYTGIRQTPEMIVEAAIQEDVDAILMSILSGAHMAIFPKVMQLLQQNNVDDVLVAAGGILPDEDIETIKAMGIKGCFGPGTSTSDIIRFVRDNVQANRLTTEV